MDQGDSAAPRLIAFYLPQFHPIPENDEWWGKGFTEWTNVAKAKPLFPGHYQPHLPADLGFYDLRVPETRQAQADLAREYGIYGFCYYHYWFNGRTLLERPLREVLESGAPDFPFCICWANENWTRRWDGLEQHVLMRQDYSPRDDLAHIRYLLPYLTDARYITVRGKPLLLVYRADLLPDAQETLATWRREAAQSGLPGLYVCNVVGSGVVDRDPGHFGADAAVEFQPDWHNLPVPLDGDSVGSGNHGPRPKQSTGPVVYDYRDLVGAAIAKPEATYPLVPCVTPRWDNTPRRGDAGRVFHGSRPDIYRQWLCHAVVQSSSRFADEDRLVFINAWNEWGEGAFLEPDSRAGHDYLRATREGLACALDALSDGEHVDRSSLVDADVLRVSAAYGELQLAEAAATGSDPAETGQRLAQASLLSRNLGESSQWLHRLLLRYGLDEQHGTWSARRRFVADIVDTMRSSGAKPSAAWRGATAELALANAFSLYASGQRSSLLEPLATAVLNHPGYIFNGGFLSMLATLLLGRRAKRVCSVLAKRLLRPRATA